MRWTVVWLPAAEADLASIWTDALDRDSITAAADALDSLLKRDPKNCGESREANRRIIYMDAFAALFRVADDDLRVEVTGVWTYRR